MNKTNLSKKKWIFCSILLGMLLIGSVYCMMQEHEAMVSNPADVSEISLIYSEENSYQNDDFTLEINTKEGYSKYGLPIHFTLDGSTPTLESPVYTEPLSFTVSDTLTTVIVKAAVSYHNQLGPVLTKTYFLGTGIKERFSLPVVCVTISEEDLYDEVNGLYTNPQNREEDWTRAAHVEIYDTDGSTLIDQNIGLSISGVSSALYEVKPFKLSAGSEWDVTSKFTNIISNFSTDNIIAFYPNYDNTDKINSIKLKNGGSADYYGSRLREVLCMELAKETGVTPITDFSPAVVFLNGEYYDLMQMTATYSANNLAKIYALNEDNVQICKDSENAIVSEFAGKEYLLTADYTNPDVIADFEETFDKESFFQYYAVEMLIGNTDWPQYNSGAWIYRGDYIEGNPYSDGKIRFLLYDTSSSYRVESEHEIFEDLLDNPLDTKSWLYHVLANPEYKRYFVNILCDLLSTTFDTEHILTIIDEKYDEFAVENDILKNLGIDVISDSAAIREDSVNGLKDKVSERIWFIRTAMSTYLGADYFNEDAKYTLNIPNIDSGMTIQCNSLYYTAAEQSFSGTYYKNYPVLLQALPSPGYAFDYWLVNGQQVTDPVFFITADMIQEHTVAIQAVCHPVTGTVPIISEVSSAGADDWITLTNPYSNELYLGTFYLTDTHDIITKYQLPKVTLASGESLTIYGENSSKLGSYMMNMNLHSGETIYLTDFNHHVVSSLLIPAMTDDMLYGRYQGSNRFYFYTAASTS